MDRAGSQRWPSRSWHWFPAALLITGAIVVIPIVVVWELRWSGMVISSLGGLMIAVALSFAISALLRLWWSHSRHRTDLLFSELLLWGWLLHWHRERQLADAARLLGVVVGEEQSRRFSVRADRPRYERVISRLAKALEAQDAFLHGHSRRVATHAEMIGRRMGLSAEELVKLRAAAAIHDVGKLYVPREVLDKPAALTEAEYALVKRHAETGAAIVSALGDQSITSIVRHHHERIDGRGYPAGLAGDAIPLGARIVAVADTFDAITSSRPYRAPAEHTEALDTLRGVAGTQLDPSAVEAFLSCYSGRRQVVVLSTLLAVPQRLLSRFAHGPGVGSIAPLSSGNALTTFVTTAVVGAGAIGVPGVSLPPARALAEGGPPRTVHAIAVTEHRKTHVRRGVALLNTHLARSKTRSRRHGHRFGSHTAAAAATAGRVHRISAAQAHGPGRSAKPIAKSPHPSGGSVSSSGKPVVAVSGRPTGGGSAPPQSSSSPPQSAAAPTASQGTSGAQGPGDGPPGHSGEPPPGHHPEGPPGRTDLTPGHDGASHQGD